MKLFDKQSLALLVSVVTINVLCIIAVSYAYFTTQIKGNDTAQPITVVMGSMKIKYEDSDLVTLDNAIPGDYLTNKFRITNTGTLDATYNLKIDVVENNFRDKGDLEYTLKRNGEPIDSGTLPYTDGYILTNVTIPSEEIHNYELEVKFKEDLVDKNQNDNKNRRVDFKIVVDSNENAEEYIYKPLYKDNSGANIPELYQGLIPIYYNDANQIVIADVTQEWYNYDEHEWANAVLIDNTNKDIVNKFYNEDGTLKDGDIVTIDDILQMYVWIPRYKYQLFNAIAGETSDPQMINVEFETGEDNTGTVSCNIATNGVETCTNALNGEWYTHPAFTFGNTKLGGIWVGKFESSDSYDLYGREENIIRDISILPNKYTKSHINIECIFNATRNIENLGKYNLNTTEIDSHPIKNNEWGAMAYLSQSKFGRCLNNECVEIARNFDYITGYANRNEAWDSIEGGKASTTGNIYGIYDTNGGGQEYVMANMVDINGEYNIGESNLAEPNKKYFDIYEYNESSNFSYYIGHLGDATRETITVLDTTRGGWYGDFVSFNTDSDSWSTRGGWYGLEENSGIYSFASHNGTAYEGRSFRVTITAQDGID